MRKILFKDVQLNHANTSGEDFDRQKNKLFNFPFLNKKEWLDMPVLNNEIIGIAEIEKFRVVQQETRDSCGTCAAKMVIETLLSQYKINKHIDEKDVIHHSFLPKLGLIKKTIGITQDQLASGIQKLLDENNIDYTTAVQHFMSYPQIKRYLKHGAYMIFSYMGDTIDNPHKSKDGEKDMLLKGVHHPHYCVLLKIDEDKKIVTIANPFGYQEELPFNEFWQRISLDPKYLHSNKLYIPLVESGIYKPRSCVIVSKKNIQ